METPDGSVDLVIINPGAAHGIYGVLGDNLIAVEPPLWCRIIAGYARDRGFSVKILDGEAHQDSARTVAAVAVAYAPQLVCIAVYGHQPSASTQQMHGAGAVARAIKEIAPNLSIIMVGGHVAALPDQTLRDEAIDYACTGEGPVTVVDLLRWQRGVGPASASFAMGRLVEPSVPSLSDVPGLVWWEDKGRQGINPPALLIEDLSKYHGDAWDLLPMDRYRAHNWQCFGELDHRQPYASIYTSLGCPYRCSFCCINAPFQSNRYRMRDPAAVVAEIVKLYRTYGVRTFKIVDEMFVLNERHYKAICRGLIDACVKDDLLPISAMGEVGLNIWAYARVDTVNPQNLGLLRSAGIKWLALGIESASAYVRDGAQKRLKNDDIATVVRTIQAAGINVIGNYIFGLPDDDEASMRTTLDLALSLNTEFANFYCAMAYPGSPLHTEALREGWTLPESWRGYSQHNDDCRPLDTKHVDAATVLRFRDEAFRAYFTNPAYLDMVGQKFGAETLEHVRAMTTYRLTRKLLAAAAE